MGPTVLCLFMHCSGKSQSSTEERRYDTQVSSPSTESPPQPPSVPPDVIAHALYEDVSTLSKMVLTLDMSHM